MERDDDAAAAARPYQRKTVITLSTVDRSRVEQLVGAPRDAETAQPASQRGRLTFDVGRAAADVRAALLAAQHWREDLLWLCAPSGVAVALSAMALGAYSIASINTGLSAVVVLEAMMALLAAGWLFSGYTMRSTALRWTLYATMAALMLVVGLVVLWLTAYRYVLHEQAWLWWTLLAVLALQMLLVFGTAMALASVYSMRLVYDKEYTRRQAIRTMVTDQIRRRGHRGDRRTEARLESGALALASAAASSTTTGTATPVKKHE